MKLLQDYIQNIRNELKQEFPVPIFTERLPFVSQEKLCVVYLDDKHPWQWIDLGKVREIYPVIEIRYKLGTKADTGLVETDAQEFANQIEWFLIQQSIPPGFWVHPVSVTCGYMDDNPGWYKAALHMKAIIEY